MRTLIILIILLSLTSLAKKKTNVSWGSASFKDSCILNPVIYTCNQDGELIFKWCPGVRVEIAEGKAKGESVRVENFMISIAKRSGETVIIKNVGAFYETVAKNAFSSLNIGDKVSLFDFVIKVGNEATPRKLTQVLSSVYSGKKYEMRY